MSRCERYVSRWSQNGTRCARMAAVAGLVVSPLTLTAQTSGHSASKYDNRAKVLNHFYARPRTYDLVHQDITLTDFVWKPASFTGHVVSTIVAQRAGQDTLRLDAGVALAIVSVTDDQGPLPYTHQGDVLILRPKRRLAKGDTLHVTIDYRATLDSAHVGKPTSGLIFVQDNGDPRHREQLWSQGEEENNHRWFPTYDAPNDKATWDITVTASAQAMVVSNGELIDDRPAVNGLHVVHWRQSRPAPTYLASLIISPLVTVHDTAHLRGHNVPLEYNVFAPDTSVARKAFEDTPHAMEVYERLTGVPYPWPRYAQTEVAEFPFGGMENVGATTVMPNLMSPHMSGVIVPHELAHQWFGDYVTTADWVNEWLNEGFATFMNGQYIREHYGVRAGQDFYFDQLLQYLKVAPTRHIALTGLSQDFLYSKGSVVLEMLRQRLGAKAFWAAIHAYLTTHALGNATSMDLARVIQRTTGKNIDQFFDEWVYSAGHPEFSIDAKYDSAAQRLVLHVAQVQGARQDTLIQPFTDKIEPGQTFTDTTIYTTPAVFHVPVAIRVGTARGDRTKMVQLHAKTQTVVFDHLPGAPTMVVFDTSDAVPKTMKFEQPTAWLVALLDAEPTTWQTAWVIEQLRTRNSDPTVHEALVRASEKAKYPRTRAVAAAALSESSSR